MCSKFGQRRIGGKPSLGHEISFSQRSQVDNKYIGRMPSSVVIGDDIVEQLNEMDK